MAELAKQLNAPKIILGGHDWYDRPSGMWYERTILTRTAEGVDGLYIGSLNCIPA